MVVDRVVNYFIKERKIQKEISMLHTLLKRYSKVVINVETYIEERRRNKRLISILDHSR